MSWLQQNGALEWVGGRRKFVRLEETQDEEAFLQHGSSFVCCMLSHGTRDGIYGSKGGILPYKDLFATINGCSSLKTKPKMFYIQACRSEPSKKKGNLPNPDSEFYLFDDVETDDVLIAWASSDKGKAMRDSKKGSWFIQSLCDQLTRGCSR